MRPSGATLAPRASTAARHAPQLPPAPPSRRPAPCRPHPSARPATHLRGSPLPCATPGTGATAVDLCHSAPGAATPTTTTTPLLPTTGLKSLTLDGLTAWVASLGDPHPTARALQVWRLLYYRDTRSGVGLVADLADAGPGVQGGLGAAFLERVAASAPGTTSVDPGLALETVHTSADGTRKLVFAVTAGPAAGRRVDAVLIPVVRRAGARPRLTLCVSSQAGCAQACSFCLTGAMGLGGNLSAGQIVEQAAVAKRLLAAEAEEAGGGGRGSGAKERRPPPPPLTNVVFMGQGEPLDNLAAVSTAASILTHPLGLAFGASKVTVSTVGLIAGMHAFAASHPRVQLALSLHATTDAGRAAIMPAAARPGHDLAALTACLRALFPDGTGRRRHVLIEYLLLAGVNDTAEDAARLLGLLEGVAAKVNLLNFNPHEAAVFGRSGAGDTFRRALVEGGRVCTVRTSRGGDDAMAACGQLGEPGAGERVAGARAARLARGGGVGVAGV